VDKNRWHKSAPNELAREYQNGQSSAGWNIWKKHLATRKRPLTTTQLWPKGAHALAWGAAQAGVSDDSAAFIQQLAEASHDMPRSWEQRAEAWIVGTSAGQFDVACALEALAWASILPTAATEFAEDVWWRLLDHLEILAEEAGGTPLNEGPLVQQLLGGELALTLAYLFPEIASCRMAAKAGRKTITAGLTELLDGEGLPSANVLDHFRPLLACWTRCRLIGAHLNKGCSSQKAGYQYEWAVRAALRLTRPDGSQAFGDLGESNGDISLLTAAVACGGDEDDEAIATLALPGGKPPKGLDESLLPAAADHSAWASVTVLRPAWGRNEPQLTIACPDDAFRIELTQQQEPLLAGIWTPEVKVGGVKLRAESAWESLCWVSDDDIDYLELELRLSGGARLQRHVALAREDHFLLLADAVVDAPGDEIEYCGRLPFGPAAGFGQAEETWEGFLLGDRGSALVLPLGLPEWRIEDREGALESADGALQLWQRGQGPALFAPLFFDLKPRRLTRQATWRRLTVGANLEIQPPHVAVGYRAMVGKSQWLFYRSLAEAANRTLLGHNLATELLIARFDRHGEVDPLIEFEAD